MACKKELIRYVYRAVVRMKNAFLLRKIALPETLPLRYFKSGRMNNRMAICSYSAFSFGALSILKEAR